MRILHLSSEYPPQQVFGLGRYVCDIAREQVSQGHDVSVLTNSMAGREQDVSDYGVAVRRVAFPPPPKPPGGVAPALAFNLHLLQRVEDLGESMAVPEVVVSHDWLTARTGHVLAQRWSVPHVWTVHDTVVGKTFGRLDTPGDLSIHAIEQWAAQVADLTIGNSRAICHELVEHHGASANRLALIHCGIDPTRFESKQGKEREQAFRCALARPEQQLISYVGRLDREKGLDILLRAFAKVNKAHPLARLVIAGKGTMDEALQALAQELGIRSSVEFVGYLSGVSLFHLYRVTDLHICPSLYEPFGIVAAEAMAAGAPLIASATGGLLDIVDSEQVGVSVPPGDVEALARAIIGQLSDPKRRKTMALRGQRHAVERFSWRTIAAQAVVSYRSAIRIRSEKEAA